MQHWHIAQMNVATALYPLVDPRIAEFVGALGQVNALDKWGQYIVLLFSLPSNGHSKLYTVPSNPQ